MNSISNTLKLIYFVIGNSSRRRKFKKMMNYLISFKFMDLFKKIKKVHSTTPRALHSWCVIQL